MDYRDIISVINLFKVSVDYRLICIISELKYTVNAVSMSCWLIGLRKFQMSLPTSNVFMKKNLYLVMSPFNLITCHRSEKVGKYFLKMFASLFYITSFWCQSKSFIQYFSKDYHLSCLKQSRVLGLA